jgi:hypothetical protein
MGGWCGHQIGLDGLCPLVTNFSAERAVPRLVGMPFDQEHAVAVAAQPRRVPIEDPQACKWLGAPAPIQTDLLSRCLLRSEGE